VSQSNDRDVGGNDRARAPATRRAFLPAIVFPLLFLVLSTINVLVYRGGHAREFLGTAYDFAAHLRDYDAARLRYSFLLNFVSDLGRLTTYHGGSNLASAALFCVTLGSVGLGFFLSFRRLSIPGLPRAVEARFLGPARFLGQASALAFAGIGLAPVDGPTPSLAVHLAFVFVAFGTVMAVCIFMTVLIARSRHYPRSCAIPFVVLFAALALFMGVMTWWGLSRSVAGYLALTVGQKIVVGLLVGTLLVQGIASARLAPTGSRR
jgi:hypothetical protein